ncbi:early endosome antigen 1 isoform X6 [Conger conger]|uniref:early endosome antigen 1 isoform X6 n=1 Tax=Conger conger TaxID=82655 RepID=UPI002A5A522D|nr:early endosome antigen 1 isoform X6 [Conger conger]
MLRRILQRTPGKGGPDQPATDVNDQTSEGFICPQCMKSHNSAEELFKHYEVFHESANQPMSPGPGREDLALLQQEVQDLHASLKEERWFSGELKKELDKVQGQLKQGPQNDGQANVEESALEMKLNEAETEKFNIKQMKDLFEQKAAQLATEIVDIKSRYDEEKSLREMAEQRISTLFQELQKEKQEKECFQAELLQRPGIEDVELLKRELVHVQSLMDNMTRAREEESEHQQLQVEHTSAEVNACNLPAKQLCQLQAKLLEAEHQLEEVQGRLKEQRQLSGEKLKGREQQVAELQLELSRIEEQLKENESKSLELQHQLDKARQSQQEVQALHQGTNDKLREAQNDLEQVLRQIGDKDQKIQNLEALLQKSRDAMSQLEAEREDLCAKIQAGEGETALFNQLQEKNHVLQEQVAQLTDNLRNQSESHKQAQQNLHEQVQEQKTHLRSAQDHCQALEISVADLSTQLNESKEKIAKMDTQLKAKTELLLCTEAAKTTQRVDLQNHLETAQLAMQDKQQELVKTQAQLGELSRKFQEKQGFCVQLEVTLKEYKDKLLTWEQRAEKLESLVKKLEAEVQEVQASRDQAQQKLLDFQKRSAEADSKVHELTCQLCTEKEGSVRLQKDLKKQSASLVDIQKQLLQQEKDKADLQQRFDSLAQEGSERRAELEKVQQEKDGLTQELKVMQEDLKKTCIQLDQNRKANLEEKKTLKQAKEQLHMMAEASAKELVEVKGQLQKMEKTEKGLESQMTAQTKLLAQTQELLKEKEKEMQQLQEETKMAQGSFDQQVKKLEGQLTSLQTLNAKKASEDKLTLAQEELKANRTQMSSQTTLIQDLKASHIALQQDSTKKEERSRQQEEALRDLQQQQERSQEQLQKEHLRTEELKEEKIRLEQVANRLNDELRANTERSNKELLELRDAKQLLIQQKLEIQGSVASSQAALEQEQREHQATRESRNRQDEELKKERAHIEAQLEMELKEKAELVKHHEEMESKLSMQVTALNENMATLKREWQGSQWRVGELEKQTDELRGEIAVLEATVQNNQDERRALLERCVKGEGEMEKLQAKVVEMRHKLDDTTAAMQELGRENQSLQIKQSQNLTRKWAEDHEVNNCMSCGKGFSVTVRKHHCRHCGNIFCGECSSKNTLTPSSKKPVRVCDTCFEELQG